MADYEISESALLQLVGYALEGVDGVRLAGRSLGRRNRPIKASREGDRVRVELWLSADYGRPLVELGREVQRAVTEVLKATTGLKVDAVDVFFVEVVPKDAA